MIFIVNFGAGRYMIMLADGYKHSVLVLKFGFQVSMLLQCPGQWQAHL